MRHFNNSLQTAFIIVLSMFVFASCQQDQYSAEVTEKAGEEIAVLRDKENNMRVNIAVSIGNNMYKLMVNDTNQLHFPTTLEEYGTTNTKHANPFMYPWSNRLEGYYYYFNDQKISVDTTDPSLYFQRDGNNLPLHGYMTKVDAWETVSYQATNEDGAIHTAKIDFSEHPRLMKNYPFPHVVTMKHILKDGTVSIQVAVENTGEKAMPVAYGFHTYYKIPPMDSYDNYLTIAAEKIMELDDQSLPTGELTDISNLLSDPRHYRIGTKTIDHVFTQLKTDEDGYSVFSLEKPNHTLNIHMGESYQYATVYSPIEEGTSFVCVEPMMAPTNGFNLYHKGIWDHLPVVQPGETQQSTFKIAVE